jgi:FtsH-binding integral membrane protein
MEDNILDYSNVQSGEGTVAKAFLSKVFTWMFTALLISGGLAMYLSNSPELMISIMQSGLGMVIIFAPLVFILVMSFGLNKIAYPFLVLLFLAFAAVMGVSLAFTLTRYAHSDIYKAFFSAAGTFGLMAFVGYTTKTDLSKFGSLMMIGFFGILIAMLVNFFLRSQGMDYLISIIGVVVFTGLSAYDVQKLKNLALQPENNGVASAKLSIMGALTLYLDFLNLFMFLLRLAGGGRK